MVRTALSVIGLLIINPLFAAANKPTKTTSLAELLKDTSVKGKFAIRGKTIDGNINTARFFSTTAFLEVEHNFNPELKLNFDGGVILATGTYDRNAVAGDGPKPSNLLSFSESNITYTPFDLFEFKVGAINQKKYSSSMLLGDIPFMAVNQALLLGNETFSLNIFAEQAYATNKDLSSTLPDSGGNQVLPKFFTEGVQFKIDYQKFIFKFIGMHWAYDKLGAGIAAESATRGNTITGNIAGPTGFKYRFQGINAATEIEIPFILESTIKGRAAYLLNQKGPVDRNYGYDLGLGLAYPTWSSSMEISGRYIKLMSDASPAYYSGFENNREIILVDITWKKETSPLEILLEAAHLEEVTPNPYMSPENHFFVGMKTEIQFL